MQRKGHMLPVWFFIGLLSVVYGVILLWTGIAEWSHPPASVLSGLHPGFCGGLILLMLGGFYSSRFRPGKLNEYRF